VREKRREREKDKFPIHDNQIIILFHNTGQKRYLTGKRRYSMCIYANIIKSMEQVKRRDEVNEVT